MDKKEFIEKIKSKKWLEVTTIVVIGVVLLSIIFGLFRRTYINEIRSAELQVIREMNKSIALEIDFTQEEVLDDIEEALSIVNDYGYYPQQIGKLNDEYIAWDQQTGYFCVIDLSKNYVTFAFDDSKYQKYNLDIESNLENSNPYEASRFVIFSDEVKDITKAAFNYYK